MQRRSHTRPMKASGHRRNHVKDFQICIPKSYISRAHRRPCPSVGIIGGRGNSLEPSTVHTWCPPPLVCLPQYFTLTVRFLHHRLSGRHNSMRCLSTLSAVCTACGQHIQPLTYTTTYLLSVWRNLAIRCTLPCVCTILGNTFNSNLQQLC